MTEYKVLVEQAGTNEFIATSPGLPGAAFTGRTESEALSKLREEIAKRVKQQPVDSNAAAKSAGDLVLEAIYLTIFGAVMVYSGRVLFNYPESGALLKPLAALMSFAGYSAIAAGFLGAFVEYLHEKNRIWSPVYHLRWFALAAAVVALAIYNLYYVL